MIFPKSIATVVKSFTLFSLSLVVFFSVVIGSISEMVLMNCVFPAAKGPDMRILIFFLLSFFSSSFFSIPSIGFPPP